MKLFYSYSHKDERFLDEIAKFMAPLRDSLHLDEWHDRRIQAGATIHGAIDRNIEDSDIILLLLSPDYLDSSECKAEMRTAMDLRRSSGTTVIPVILRPCGWKSYPIQDLRAVPTDAVPVADWASADSAYLDIYHNIKNVVENMPFHPTTEYLASLTEVEFISQNKADITLDDIFVFPNIESSLSQRSVTDFDQIWALSKHVILHGDERAGKTVICRQLVLNESRHNRPVMLLSASELTTSRNHEQLIRRKFREHFRGSYDYWKSRPNRMLIIDDMYSDTKTPFISYAKDNFERILLVMPTDEYLAYFKGEESVADFDLVALAPLGHATQEDLLRKWLSLNSNHSGPRRISDGKIDQIEDQLNTVILHNRVVPRYPFYVLSILQSLEAFMPQGLQITAYGHCYQALITAQIVRMGISPSDVDTALNFLRHFAYRTYLESKCCSHASFAEFLDEYRDEFEIKESIWRRLSSDHSLILKKTPAGYQFKYPFVYYFFFGHYLAQFSEQHSDIVERLADSSYARDNAYILTFVIHHAQDTDLIDTILLHTACSLDSVDVATLETSEIRFVEKSLKDIPKRIVSRRSVSEERNLQRHRRDQVEANSHDIESDLSFSEDRNELYRLLKNMEILGQVLRNRHGSMRRNKLAEIVGFVTEAGLRAVSMFRRDIVHIARLCSEMLDDEDIPEDIRSDVETLRDQLANLAFLVVQLVLRKIVVSIQKPEIARIVQEVFRKYPTPAYRILQGLFTLSTREDLDDEVVSDLERLYDELDKANNAVAVRLLSLEMQAYLNTHHVRYQERQKMFSILGFKYRPNRV